MIAAHALDVPCRQQVETCARIVVVADPVAGAENAFDAFTPRPGERGRERGAVAVDVREQPDPHRQVSSPAADSEDVAAAPRTSPLVIRIDISRPWAEGRP